MTTIRGSAEKSYLGGAILEIASTTASMLNFSWAETGMIGASPAVVPVYHQPVPVTVPGKARIVRLTLHKLPDRLAVLDGLGLSHQIHLVLQNDDVVGVDTDDLQCCQVFTGLGLGTRFVTGDEQESTVHYRSAAEPNNFQDDGQLTDGGTRQHGSHKNVVTGTVDERDMSIQDQLCPAAYS